MKNASYFQNIAAVEILAPVGFMMLSCSPIYLRSILLQIRGDLLQGVREIQRARLSCICRGFPSARFIKFRGL